MKLRDLFHWLAMCVSAWVLAGCTVFTHEMTDFKGLSVAYGWLDISEVNGNLITKLYLKQTQPKTDEPFQGMGVQKFNKGFIYYHFGMPNGAYKLDDVTMIQCLGIICLQDVNTYSQGDESTVARTSINRQGVYYMGAYAFKPVKTGSDERGRFKVEETSNAPSQKEMLTFLLTQEIPSKHPEVAELIRKAMR